jgi:hypothetical protein
MDSAAMIISDVKVVSDTEAAAEPGGMLAGTGAVKFRLLNDKDKNEDYWFIDSPLFAGSSGIVAQLEQSAAIGELQFAKAQSGPEGAEQVLVEHEQVSQMMSRVFEAGKAPPSSEARPKENTKGN